MSDIGNLNDRIIETYIEIVKSLENRISILSVGLKRCEQENKKLNNVITESKIQIPYIDEVVEEIFNNPIHYTIADKISTKRILDDTLNSEYIKSLNLTPSQIFELGNILKYRIRAGKKDIATVEKDIGKAIDFENRLKVSLDRYA